MTSVTFTPDVGGDNITIDDTDSATTGLANGGHRTRFMIALQQLMKLAQWIKTTAATVLGYRDAAATSASQAQTYAAAAQAAAGIPSLTGNANKILAVNAGATGVAWVQTLPSLTVAALTSTSVTATGAIAGDTLAAKSTTLTDTAPSTRYVESDQSGAAGVFMTQVQGGLYSLVRNTAAARDYSTSVAEHVVNGSGRHLFGGAADNTADKFQFLGDLLVTGNLKATANVTWTSDARVKQDIVTIEGALGLVESLRGVRYTRSDMCDGRAHVGVIAQEVREVLPEAVIEGADGLLAVDYGTLGPVLIEAVKALSQRVRQLEGARA
ncbi:tail fiber domain-containing protein [Cupriavidus pinatubonensis]|uniref:tail fiber domain-containing protein n=1 Tax=Cupriavidus pinatubonensis TaxID=248026 RepID=UPI001C72CAEC|nr:tail fiber domain-containing protein [Cupriavidus pinatubonensis]QYY30301.1 tail fiber domain-containing protein [Cupriavidus pinatubonensis]